MLLVIKNWVLKKILIIKQRSIELINWRSQTNWDQKSNLLLLQWFDQSQKFRLKLVKNRQKVLERDNIYNIGYIKIKNIDGCENI